MQWPDGTVGPWMTVNADSACDDRARRILADALDTGGLTTWSTTRTAAPGRHPRCPTSGCPMPSRSCRRRLYADRLQRLRLAMDERGYDRLVVWADREHSAEPRVPERVRPTIRGGAARPGSLRRSCGARRERVRGHGRGRTAADAACDVPGHEPSGSAARCLGPPAFDPARRGDPGREPGRRHRMEDLCHARARSRRLRSSSMSCDVRLAPPVSSRTRPTS